MSQILFKQILVCENALSNPETINADGAIDALFHVCPASVRQKVVSRSREFRETKEVVTYDYWANVRQEASKKVTEVKHVNYRSLYDIIMQELEAAKMTYRYDSITQVIGNTKEKEAVIPLQTIERVKMELNKILSEDVATGSKYNLWDLLNRIMPPLPATPLLAETEDENIEVEEDDQS